MTNFFELGRSNGRAVRLKKAVLASFTCAAPEVEARFAVFEAADWRRILYWLDISGLALYLLDRLTVLRLEECLPESIRLRFQQDLEDNRVRTKALLAEAGSISHAMRRCGIMFALLKGITLTPDSVPDCALRWQIDLDFLVAAGDATAARHVFSTFGYTLRSVCGNSMEFTAGYSTPPDIRKIYRVHSQRSLELHMLSTTPDRSGRRTDRLARAQVHDFDGVPIPALASADILVQQAVHLFKHLCGEHTRTSWVLEFWRHVQAKRGDELFWAEVDRVIAPEPHTKTALAAALLLASMTFGSIQEDAWVKSAIDNLPQNICLWLETFGMRVLLTDSPANKLYLILRQELRSETPNRPAIRRLVFPTHLPPAITRGTPGERLRERVRRYRTESWFVLSRLHFHVVEGLRYAIELSRWQRRVTEISR